ncbi:protein kinase [Gemmatirosa kalamazoonensis]|uniref:Protein kinase n=1 Tax=Gemmatirosa kalamazoonensis TaxID=861299 RepID=W0RMV6_9BACT|nr:FHA domain-containing serine/threonine-protein kinase [Gemmatirosa kalamazoonensis]AHG91655.1 protein kinase [Gemmatirosa kalamazoonensis]
MVFCSTCGHGNADGVAFCVNCGVLLASRPAPVPAPPPPPPPPSHTLAATRPATTLVTSLAATLVRVRPQPQRIPPLSARLRGWMRRPTTVPPPLPPPFRIYPDKREVTVPLLPAFRFVHEPVGQCAAPRFVGRRNELESLAERILFSEGGSFLVTGYRGVGKTSFVNQVIRTLDDSLAWARTLLGETEVVDVYLNVARPVRPGEMMHHIIRRLHDRLRERGIYERLDADLRDALTLAFQRTSMNMARQTAESSELGVDEASLGGEWMKAALKLSLTAKRSRSSQQETSFLGYDDKAAEHDVITISRRLAAGYVPPTSRWRRFRDGPPARVRLKIIFVFDELDKLEEFARAADGEKPRRPAIDGIIGALKNLFTTSGITFIFVAGKDLHERWLEDVGRGDSVYESVFAYDKYLPCLWTDVDAICDTLVDDSNGWAPWGREVYAAFKKYLAYRGRGIPRRIIRTFNEYVEWDGHRPALAFTAEDVRRVRLFAGLQDLIDAHAATLFGESHEEVVGTQSDKRRLGVYYLIDWILRRGTAEFTLKDVLDASRRLSAKIALAEEIAPRVAEDIVRILLDAEYIQSSKQSLSRVVVGAAAAEEGARYRVTARRLVELGARATTAELDALDGDAADAAPGKGTPAPKAVGRFRIVREIGRGGMGVVYEALDERSGERVAVKLLLDALANNDEMVARFEREARVLGALDHPNIVRLRDTGRSNGHVYIAMDLVDGVTAEEVVRRCGRLDLDTVVAIAGPAAEAIDYVHQHGFVRNDVKPENIMVTSAGRVCVLDFGISRRGMADGEHGSRTRDGMLVGTPRFISPEQALGRSVDERSDVYSFGVVLYRLLTGVYPFDDADLVDVLAAHAHREPPPLSRHAPIAPEVEAIVLRCLAKDPADRYERMSAVANELRAAAGNDAPVDLQALVREVRDAGRAVEALDQARTNAGVEPVAEHSVWSGGDEVSLADLPTPHWTPALPAAQAAPVKGAAAPVVASRTAPGLVAAPPPTPYTPPDPTRAPRPGLALVDGPADHVSSRTRAAPAGFRLEGRTTLGRNSENDIVLAHWSVSRYHAVLDVDDGGWFVEDANSSNGTAVAGERILGRRPLRDGEEIRMGVFGFVFRR